VNYYGDIPKQHLDLLKELKEQEAWFNENGSTVSPVLAAKAFVCLAHDYYHIYFDEEGERFLRLADKIYPGYFSSTVYGHMIADYEFAFLVKNLERTMGIVTMVSLGFGSGHV
jgi:hypothetical protein